jgi:hypothetical protein
LVINGPNSKTFRYFLFKQEGSVLAKKSSHTIVPLRIYGAKKVKNQDFAVTGTSNPANIKDKAGI